MRPGMIMDDANVMERSPTAIGTVLASTTTRPRATSTIRPTPENCNSIRPVQWVHEIKKSGVWAPPFPLPHLRPAPDPARARARARARPCPLPPPLPFPCPA